MCNLATGSPRSLIPNRGYGYQSDETSQLYASEVGQQPDKASQTELLTSRTQALQPISLINRYIFSSCGSSIHLSVSPLYAFNLGSLRSARCGDHSEEGLQ